MLFIAVGGMLVGTITGSGAPPNILFLFADDQSYEMVAALSGMDIDTPNLDRLTRNGTVFTHAYNMGSWSGAVCIASRTMLNTGRYLWKAQAVYDHSEAERQAGRWWSEYMKGAGYDTYLTGKWHVRADAAMAFDFLSHVRPGMPNQTPAGYHRPPPPGQPDPWSPSDPSFGGYWERGEHWSEVAADDAVNFLRLAGERDRPFFMYVAFNAPHDPRQSPQEYLDRYPLDRVKVPENFLPEYPYKDAMGCGENLRDESLAPFPRTPRAIQVHRREYAAIVSHLDFQIGRILEALRQSPHADNTWIFFTADHGLAVGHHGLMGKQNQYDHSVRVPFIVAGPGVPRGARIPAPIYLQDVMPTVLELAGVQHPEHVDFHSLLPLLNGQSDQSPYPAIYGAYLDRQRMITAEGHKLILYPTIAKARLYDLNADPLEQIDLAESPGQRELMRRLFTNLLELQSSTGDTLDLVSAFPDLTPNTHE